MRKVLVITLTALVALGTIISGAAASGGDSGARITTDRTDYKPGQRVMISGRGFTAHESIRIELTKDGGAQEALLTSVADARGAFVNRDYVPGEEDRGAKYDVVATGQSSGNVARTSFTDGIEIKYGPAAKHLDVTAGGPAGTTGAITVTLDEPAAGTPESNVTLTPNVSRVAVCDNGTGPTCAGGIIRPALPANFSVSISPASNIVTVEGCTVRNQNCNGGNGDNDNFTVNITAPSGATPGVYSALFNVSLSGPAGTVSQYDNNGATKIFVTVLGPSDTNPPTTTLTATVPGANNTPEDYDLDWTNQDVTVTLAAQDNVGVAAIYYNINNGADILYTGPFVVSNEGETDINYYAVDVNNNASQPQVSPFTIKIDKTNPAANCGSADGLWHSDNVSITCSPSDSGGSGLVSPGNFTLSTNVAAGSETANASTDSQQVCDTAGNCVTAGPVSGNKIDRKAPEFNCPGASGSWLGADAVINCTSTDGGSGPASGNFSLTTSVPNGTEDPNASTDTAQVCDAVNNCVTAGPVTGNKVDKKAPSISCGSADGNWHADDVSIACTSSDGGSGIAQADASFSLSTSVAANTETDNASTGSKQVCDGVNNCGTAGPIGGNMIDKKGPTVAFTIPSGNYLLNQIVASNFTVSDGGSGVASHNPASGGNVPTTSVGNKMFDVTATDNVGNPGGGSASYTVSYQQAGGACGGQGHVILQPINVDGSSVFKKGSTVPAKFRVYDANCNSVGTPGLVTSFYLVAKGSADGAPINEEVISTSADTAFRWDSLAQQWIFNINTKNLNAGVKYFYRVTLNDNSAIDFAFNLK